MLHVGLDLCRSRVDVHVMDALGEAVLVTTSMPDADGLRVLVERVAAKDPSPVTAVIESMTGARFVRDALVGLGWAVQIADAAKAKGLAPLTCKTDKIDARVLAELSRRDLVPAIWLPPPGVRAARERCRFRRHLIKHRTMLKARIRSTLMTAGVVVPMTDVFGAAGRVMLANLGLAEPWATTVATALAVIDFLDGQLNDIDKELGRLARADPVVRRLVTVPGVAVVLGATIAAELGDIHRFPSPGKLVGYTGLCPWVYQSGKTDRRGPLTKAGPAHLRWALIEAAVHAAAHPAYRDRYQRTKTRLGKQRGPKVARIEVARSLATAIWHMLTTDKDFAPAGAGNDLAA